ncbi:putative Solute carrier family 35 member C2 [Hypsibius exemplaris]|uniref:Solute carrier family 35 member C2 n=1 Tax=Hypsibius exemplaris TaxID=2072580 RepID=A0A1W0W8G0_HYPEX|nr:putative Solute carrier family 35 member C2 [Hypsibius exemplaris]
MHYLGRSQSFTIRFRLVMHSFEPIVLRLGTLKFHLPDRLSVQLTDRPTVCPSYWPTDRPSARSTGRPTVCLSDGSTDRPSVRPNDRPSARPTGRPSHGIQPLGDHEAVPYCTIRGDPFRGSLLIEQRELSTKRPTSHFRARGAVFPSHSPDYERMVQRKVSTFFRKRLEKLTKSLKSALYECGMSGGVDRRLSLTNSPTETLKSHQSINQLMNQHQHSLASKWFLIYVLKTVLLVSIYYVFSIGLTFYQKKFVEVFEFPLTIVTGHFAIKFLLAALVRGIWFISSGTKRPVVSCQNFVTRIGPAGMAAALDIGLSNWSLMFITISLYTMTKSSAIVFILIFALLLRLEKFKWSLLIVVGLISSGLFLFTFESTQFHPLGFCLVLGASVLSGIIAIVFEGRTVLEAHSFYTREETVRTLLLVMGGGVAGFLMEVSEYILLSHTSSLTLSVAGITKEIFQFILAYAYNGDRISPMNFVGLVVCMSGVVVHVVFKLVEQNRKLAHLEAITAPEEKESMAVALLTPESLGEWDDLEEIDLRPSVRNLS